MVDYGAVVERYVTLLGFAREARQCLFFLINSESNIRKTAKSLFTEFYWTTLKRRRSNSSSNRATRFVARSKRAAATGRKTFSGFVGFRRSELRRLTPAMMSERAKITGFFPKTPIEPMQMRLKKKKAAVMETRLQCDVSLLPPFARIDNQIGDVGNMLCTLDFLNFLMVLTMSKRQDALLERTTELELPVTRSAFHHLCADCQLHLDPAAEEFSNTFKARYAPRDLLPACRNLQALELCFMPSQEVAARGEVVELVKNTLTYFQMACEQGAMAKLKKLDLCNTSVIAYTARHHISSALAAKQLPCLTHLTVGTYMDELSGPELAAIVTNMATGCPLLQEFDLCLIFHLLEADQFHHLQSAFFENTWLALKVIDFHLLEAPRGEASVALRSRMKEAFAPSGTFLFPSLQCLVIGESEGVEEARTNFSYFPETMPQVTSLVLNGRALRNPLLYSEKDMTGIFPGLVSLDVCSLMFGLPAEIEIAEKPEHINAAVWALIVAQQLALHNVYKEDFLEETFQCMNTLASLGGAKMKLQSFALGPMFITNFKSEIKDIFFDNDDFKMLDSVKILEFDSFRFNDLEAYFVDNLDPFSSGSVYIRDQGEAYGISGDPEFDARAAIQDEEDWTFLRLLLDQNVGGLRKHVKTLKLSLRVGCESESLETLELVTAICKRESLPVAVQSVFDEFRCSIAQLETAVDDYAPEAAPWPLTIALLGTGFCEELRYIVESKEDWARVFCKFEQLDTIHSFDEELIAAISRVTPPQLNDIVCCSRCTLKRLVKGLEHPIYDYFPHLLIQPEPISVMVLDDDEQAASLPFFSSPFPMRFVFESHGGGARYVIHEQLRSRIDLSRRNPRNTLGLLEKYF